MFPASSVLNSILSRSGEGLNNVVWTMYVRGRSIVLFIHFLTIAIPAQLLARDVPDIFLSTRAILRMRSGDGF